MSRSRSIDIRASKQEWDRLFQWIEQSTIREMKVNDYNPWVKPETEDNIVLLFHGWVPMV